MSRYDSTDRRGFTLVELSITLVVIGLIIGGIVVGKELIAEAANRYRNFSNCSVQPMRSS